MTGTSRALRRLGVAGLGAVVAYAGFVPLALNANAGAAGSGPFTATTATSVSLSAGDTAAVGTCNPFTATISPAGSSFSVNIQQTAAGQTTPVGSTTIGFCNPTTKGEGNPGAVVNGPGPNGASQPATGATTCSQPITTSSTTATCNTTYTDNDAPAANDGKVTFGVTSNTAGTMTVTAFGDAAPANGAKDVGESGQSQPKTWVANNTTGTSANSNTVSCTPASATNPTGTAHNFTCTVKDANGVALANQVVHFKIAPGGPDSALAEQTCPATADGTAGTTTGQTTCTYNNNGTPGTDTINIWLETNGIAGQQTGEPSTSISKTWVQAAAQGSTVSVTCSPNQTTTVDSASLNQPAGVPGVKPSSICQDPTSDKTVTLTATVANGVPPSPQAGILVAWALTNDTEPVGAPATETAESLSATTCTTDATGKCSVTLTNPAPNEGESITVRATIQRQGIGGPAFASAVKNWHDPGKDEARNIAVSPKTATQPSGGVQTLVALVTDRFLNPVKGAFVNWTETGPGAFRGGANQSGCTTDATGKCSVDVSSLSTESGDETVTADLTQNYSVAGGNPTATPPTAECNAPKDNSFYTAGTPSTTNSTPPAAPNSGAGGAPGTYNATGNSPSAGGGNNTATGAPAGNCSDSAKVTWQTGSNNGSVNITSATNNNPPACAAFTISGTAPSGSTVTLTGFNFHSHTFTIGTATAGADGKWTFNGSGICYNTTVTASTGSGAGATNSNTVTLGFHETFSGVRFTRVGPYRRGLIEYNVSGNSTYVPDEPIRVQNSACRSELCGITHLRSPGTFDRLHIYLKPGTYSLRVNSTGGTNFDGHQYLNGFTQSFTVTIH